VAVLVINGIIGRMFIQNSFGYDLIVGPKGSALQLVLNTVYRVSQPIENLPYSYYLQLKDDPWIEEAVPFALGDVTEEGGFPIVGTVSRYFELDYIPGRHFMIRGKGLGNRFDAIIGDRVRRENGWDVGTQFTLVHGGADTGHVHDEKFTVVGVLAPTGTPNDKTVFINLDGFYAIEGHDKPLAEAIAREGKFFGKTDEQIQKEIEEAEKHAAAHGHHDHSSHGHDDHDHHHHDHEILDVQKEVTAILLRMKRDTMGPLFRSRLQKGYQAQAVNPIYQMRWLMDNIVGNVRTMLVVLTSLIIVVSGVGIFVSIYNSMADRKREIAIMRALGASRTTVFSIILAESVLLCFGGGLLGILMGHGLVFASSGLIERRSGILIDPLAFEPMELIVLPVMIVLASLVGFIPGMTAYRTDVAKTLAD
jgi:putative ABC transport system permease protein